MPIIDVKKIIIEQIDKETNDVIENGRKYELDCSTSMDMEPVYINGEERVYQDETAVVLHNVTAPNIYGYDLIVNTADFTLSMYAFLSDGMYNDGSFRREKNIFLNNWDGTWTAGWSESTMRNRNWFAPMEVSNNEGFSGTSGSYSIVNGIDVNNPGSVASGTPDSVRTYTRRFVKPDSIRSLDTVYNDSLIALSNTLRSNGGERTNYVVQEDGTTIAYGLQSVPGASTSPVSSGVAGSDGTGWARFKLLSSCSIYAMSSGTYSNNTWMPTAQPNTLYNLVFGLENVASTTKTYTNSDGSTEPRSLSRFMRDIPARQKPYFSLYITANPNARTMFEYFPGETGRSSVVEYDEGAALSMGIRLRSFINDDPYVILDKTFAQLEGELWSTTETSEEYLHKVTTYRKQFEFEPGSNFMLTAYMYYYVNPIEDISTWDTTAEVFTVNAPVISFSYRSLTFARNKIDNQPFVFDYYDTEEEYLTDAERYFEGDTTTGIDDDLLLGHYKTLHSSMRNYLNFFKMTLYADNYSGADHDGYYRLEFPVCYADPIPLTINKEFLEYDITIHARDDYIKNRSSLYINMTVEDEPEEEISAEPTIFDIIEGASWIEGEGEPGAEVVVILPNGNELSGTVTAGGDWFVISIGAQLVAKQTVEAYQTEDGKLPSPRVSTVVRPRT